MKKRDIITLISIVILILLSLMVSRLSLRSDGSLVKITQNGDIYGIYSLNESNRIVLSNNTISIANGKVSMSEASCPDRLCVNHAPISKVGETIACLPEKVIIEIIDDSPSLSRTSLHFDTVITITLLDTSDNSLLDKAESLCTYYEGICSRTNPDSELYMLNHRLLPSKDILLPDGTSSLAYAISPDLYTMIETGLEYYKLTDGVFDITIAPVTELWNFSSGSHIIPDEDAIHEALSHVSCDNIVLLPDNMIAFTDSSTMIDLGGLAKGYIGDCIARMLISEGVKNATISLGGDCVVLGTNHGNPFKIGIQKPFDTTGSAITVLDISDSCIVTSGIYERYFESDNRIYHHIINPKDGFPFDNDLLSVSVLCDKGIYGDCMGTYLYSLGLDGAANYLSSHKEVKAVLIDSDMNLHSYNF